MEKLRKRLERLNFEIMKILRGEDEKIKEIRMSFVPSVPSPLKEILLSLLLNSVLEEKRQEHVDLRQKLFIWVYFPEEEKNPYAYTSLSELFYDQKDYVGDILHSSYFVNPDEIEAVGKEFMEKEIQSKTHYLHVIKEKIFFCNRHKWGDFDKIRQDYKHHRDQETEGGRSHTEGSDESKEDE